MKEIVGTILSEGFRDGSDVRCKVVIHDIDKVKKTPYRELSLGYNLDLIEEPGEWNGEPYDAIQTNIRINHLAIVESARAGEQAHLNLDGKKVELDDKKSKGGNSAMKTVQISLNSIDKVKSFVNDITKFDYDLTCIRQIRYRCEIHHGHLQLGSVQAPLT